MNIEQVLLSEFQTLTPDKKQEVIDFIGYLRTKQASKPQPMVNPRGLWANLNIDVSEQDITELRQEMWSKFPREDI